MNTPREMLNVSEAYPLYDSLIICSELYGKEKKIDGWFTSFNDFAAQEVHSFFKNRTMASAHQAYCNMQSADSMDFSFRAFSFGIRFWGPVVADSKPYSGTLYPIVMQEGLPAFWMFDLPSHSSIEFIVQQDTVIESPCMATPPGYGPSGVGISAMTDEVGGAVSDPVFVQWGTQGVPRMRNRFPLPNPIEIPRTASIEARLYLGPYIREILASIYGPTEYPMIESYDGASDRAHPPTRYGITVSLFGERFVQQRGQYHR